MASKGIEYFVFTKVETTGRQWEDCQPTRIVELSFIAVNRKDMERAKEKSMPSALKMNMIFCPGRYIQEQASNSHDLTVDYVQNAPSFEQCATCIVAFLELLVKPVCLVAHNGNGFDFKHLKTEFNNAGTPLPADLLCADSMRIFCHILKEEGDLRIAKNMTVKLPMLYKMLFDEQPDSITAEEKAVMTLDCALLKNESFLRIVDKKCKLFSTVLPA